jgi:hypothetical protein
LRSKPLGQELASWRRASRSRCQRSTVLGRAISRNRPRTSRQRRRLVRGSSTSAVRPCQNSYGRFARILRLTAKKWRHSGCDPECRAYLDRNLPLEYFIGKTQALSSREPSRGIHRRPASPVNPHRIHSRGEHRAGGRYRLKARASGRDRLEASWVLSPRRLLSQSSDSR